MPDSETDTETVGRDEVDDIVQEALDAAEERMDEQGGISAEEVRSIMQDEMSDMPTDSGPTVNVEVGEHRAADDDGLRRKTAELYRAIAQGRDTKIRDTQETLFEAGHYLDLASEIRADGFQTLVDDAGGVFLPTSVADEIYDIEDQVGAFSQFATELPLEAGETLKVPNVLGSISFDAVNEYNAVTANRFNFGQISLDADKWATIINWSREMEEAAGAQLLDIVNRKIAIASARFKDDTFLNGDGGSSYHGVRGLHQRADDGDITKQSATSGASSFSALNANDYLQLQTAIPADVRSQGVYVTHPDRKYQILSLQTSNEGFYFYQPSTQANDLAVDRLWGRPIYFTDQAPNSDSSSEPYAAYLAPDYVAYGRSETLSTMRLTEATVQDQNGDNINLATQFGEALRVREDADFEFGLENAFAEGTLN